MKKIKKNYDSGCGVKLRLRLKNRKWLCVICNEELLMYFKQDGDAAIKGAANEIKFNKDAA